MCVCGEEEERRKKRTTSESRKRIASHTNSNVIEEEEREEATPTFLLSSPLLFWWLRLRLPFGGGLLGMMLRRVAPPASGDEAAAAGSTTMPEWLETLLSTRFFLACGAHPASPRNECNMFCLDCPSPSPAFCYYCRSHRHQSHRVIQIRRSSYHDVVRVTEVDDVLDISGVQTYVINSAKVLFLNERPQPRGAGAAAGKAAASPYNCEICARALLDPFRFCSLGCKLVDTKTGGRVATVPAGEVANDDAAGGSKNVGGARPQGRRRKGIPQRAPFGS